MLFFNVIFIIIACIIFKLIFLSYKNKQNKNNEKIIACMKLLYNKFDKLKVDVSNFQYINQYLYNNFSIIDSILNDLYEIKDIKLCEYDNEFYRHLQYELIYNAVSRDILRLMNRLEYLFVLVDIVNNPFKYILKNLIGYDNRNMIIHYHYINLKKRG